MSQATARQCYTAQHREALRVVIGSDGLLHTGESGRIRVDPSDSLFSCAVIADLGELDELPDGPETLRLGDELGQPVVIRKPDQSTDPPNGWTRPDDVSAGTTTGIPTGQFDENGKPLLGTGAGCGSTILYDPLGWPGDTFGWPSRPAALLILLRYANCYAGGRAEPAVGPTAGR